MGRKMKVAKTPTEWPEIFVVLPDKQARNGYGRKTAKAQIKRRIVGNKEVRYLSFRDGESIKNLYIGSCTPHAEKVGGKAL